MDIRYVMTVLRRQWLVIAVCALLAVGIAALYTMQLPKSYAASARVYVSFAGERASADGTVVRSLTSPTQVAQRLDDFLALADTDFILQPAAEAISGTVPVTAGELGATVTVSRPQGSILFINAVGSDPEKIATLANGMALVLGAKVQELETPPGETTSLLTATVVDTATPPTKPFTPDPVRNILIGLIVGLAVGVATAFARTALDRGVKSAEQLSELTETPVLSVVPFDPATKGNPIIPSGKSPQRSEALRTLRTNLEFVRVDNPPKVIALVSAVASEGKSTTAANLALTLALAGFKVALVETDLRKPKLDQYFGVSGELGLTDVLANRATLDEVILPWNRGIVSLVTRGDHAPNPTELLGSSHMDDVLAQLREEFDYVVVDTPPLLMVSDAAVVAAKCDGAILVARFGRATKDSVRSAVATLRQVNADLLGAVLTMAPKRSSGYGYGYGHGYGYGYGYGYGSSGYAVRGMVYEEPPTESDEAPENTEPANADAAAVNSGEKRAGGASTITDDSTSGS